ncbi:DUF6625 family protein [Erythrobacter sp. QSSC1-22B]|uniref:DUF6625 family protein n=1 Tax=Erythrobacter sp. QSSC1-22B TaxID=1860125 RepID=UPI002696BD7A
MKNARALLIIPYFGTLGPWFPLYIRSLSRQSTLDLLLISDDTPAWLPDNARRLEMSLSDFRTLAQQKIGSAVKLPTARHLCDLKPAYGHIFHDYLEEYDYWAFGDEDVLYGDVDRLLSPLLDGAVDVISPDQRMTVGHLTVLRNRNEVNKLALDDPIYLDILSSGEFTAYDECSWARGIPDFSSFTKVVQAAEARGDVRVRWGFPIRGDIPWPGTGIVYNGKSIHTLAGEELVYFHWGRAKMRCRRFPSLFRFPDAEEAERGFAYDRFGVYNPGSFFGCEQMRTTLRTFNNSRVGRSAERAVLAIGRAIARLEQRTS